MTADPSLTADPAVTDDSPARSQEPVDIARRIEAILLVVDEPQSLVALAAAVGSPVPAVRQAVDALVRDYDGETGAPRRGFELREVGGAWALTNSDTRSSCSSRTYSRQPPPTSRSSNPRRGAPVSPS